MKDFRVPYSEFKQELLNEEVQWNAIETAPKDGTIILLKCGKNWKGETLYDVGQWFDYTKYFGFKVGDLEGEWTTEFGSCDEILGWAIAK